MAGFFVLYTEGMNTIASAAIALLLFLAPGLAIAEDSASTTPNPPRIPAAPLKVLRDTASTTKANIQDFVEKRRADVKALLDRKPKGEMSSTTRATMEQKRAELRDRLEAKKGEVHDRIEAAREKAKEKFGDAMERKVSNITDRLTKAAEHLTSIVGRIDARIKERESQGKNMSVSIGLLAEARTAIAGAQDKTAAVGTALTAALSSTTPKQEMPKVRAAVKAAEDALKAARESLHKTLESVRAEAHASSTAATTTN